MLNEWRVERGKWRVKVKGEKWRVESEVLLIFVWNLQDLRGIKKHVLGINIYKYGQQVQCGKFSFQKI